MTIQPAGVGEFACQGDDGTWVSEHRRAGIHFGRHVQNRYLKSVPTDPTFIVLNQHGGVIGAAVAPGVAAGHRALSRGRVVGLGKHSGEGPW